MPTMIEHIWTDDIQQRLFRELVNAFSHPGTVRDLTTLIGASSMLRAILATLMDGAVTLADPQQKIAREDWSLLQARQDLAERARYCVASGQQAPDFQPALGTLENPDLGATIMIEVDAVGSGATALNVSGPGVRGTLTLHVDGLHPDWLSRRQQWTAAFPLGVDLILFDSERVVALPRSTRIEYSPIEFAEEDARA